MVRTNLSAWAFRFGDRGGSFTVCVDKKTSPLEINDSGG
jgi:hypothetical protein